MAKRIRIGVIYGGRSSEHPISVVSAGSVLGALDPTRYEIVTIGITQSGTWVNTEVDPANLTIANRQLPQVAEPDMSESEQAEAAEAGSIADESVVHDQDAHDHVAADAMLDRVSGQRGVQLFRPGSAISALDGLDVVIPMLHGAYGEDGTIQGLLEMAGIAYVGSGVLASAAAMDKVFAKVVLAAAGLEVAPYLVAHRDRPMPGLNQLEGLGLPLFVKPARAGSSVGITRLTNLQDLPDALKLAFEFDSKALIERAIVGRELECGVLQDADGTVSASLPAEIRLHPDFDWYSFDAKYLDDASDFDIPAGIDGPALDEVRRQACEAFQALDCAGLARVDFFLTEAGRFVVNEVNTMPGFTPISMYPKMWAASGVGYAELLDRLVATALARH